MEEQHRCTGINKGGGRCQARALPSSRYCIFHDPTKAEVRDQARRDGGRARSNKARARKEIDGTPLDTKEMAVLLSEAIRKVHADKMLPSQLTAIAAGIKTLHDLLDGRDIQLRLMEQEGKVPAGTADAEWRRRMA